MNLSVGAKTDPGRRANNEDQLAVVDVRRHRLRADGVLVIADGMGGRNFGERAASAAVETVQETLVEMLDADRADTVNVSDALDSALRKANARVYEVAAQNAESRGMGTTCVAAVVEGDRLFLAHAGDSRAYLLRGQHLVRLTDDHSYVAEQVRAGTLSEENARRSRFRNVITRAIGIEPTITPDLSEHDLQSGDWVLLCTDGLSNMVADPEMVQTLLAASSAQDAADRLVQIASRNGGRDNITAIAARMEAGNRTQRMRKQDLARVMDEEEPSENKSAPPSSPPLSSGEANGTKASSKSRPAQGTPDEETPTVPPRVQTPPSPSSSGSFQTPPPTARAQFTTPARESAPARVRVARGVVALLMALSVLSLVLIAAVLALGQTLSRAGYRFHTYPPFASKPPPPPVPAPPDFSRVAYAAPVLLSPIPIQGSLLALAEGREIAVLSVSGQVLHLGVRGETVAKYPLPQGYASPSASSASAPARGGTQSASAVPVPASRLHWALDMQGNLYVADAVRHTLRQYRADGAFVRSIAVGLLAQPESLAVASDGTIYIVDAQRLKVISPAQTSAAPTLGHSAMLGI